MVHPLHDNVLVRRIDADERTTGGIIIPDNAKEKPLEAVVVSVGPGRRDARGKRVRVDVKARQRVLFARYSGAEVRLDGVDHIVIREADILAVVG